MLLSGILQVPGIVLPGIEALPIKQRFNGEIMRKLKILAVFFLIFVFCFPVFANRDANMEPASDFFLPKGNPEAGRKAFKDLQCNACHGIENDPELANPSGLGPLLGAQQAAYSSGWIANSMVSPSHTIALGAEDQGEDEPSLMGDFKDRMTVQQLIDLTAYLKSLGPKQEE